MATWITSRNIVQIPVVCTNSKFNNASVILAETFSVYVGVVAYQRTPGFSPRTFFVFAESPPPTFECPGYSFLLLSNMYKRHQGRSHTILRSELAHTSPPPSPPQTSENKSKVLILGKARGRGGWTAGAQVAILSLTAFSFAVRCIRLLTYMKS